MKLVVGLRLAYLFAVGLCLASCGSGGGGAQNAMSGLIPTGAKSFSRSAQPSDGAQPTITYAHNIVEQKGSLSVANTVTTSQPAAGNLLIANIIDYTYHGGGAIVDPPGWTLLDSATTSSTLTSKTYYRWVQPGDTGIWTFNFTQVCYNSVLIMELVNVNPVTPFAAHQITGVASKAAFTTASLSSLVPNSFAVALFSTNGATTIASETNGWTDDYHRSGGLQNVLLHEAANGPTQSSLSWANVESGFAALIVLSPSLTAPPSPTPAPTSTPLAVAPYHIATWAFDGGYGADNVAASDVARLVSYAEGSGKAIRDCHSTTPASCAAVMYFDPDIMYQSTYCTTADDALIKAAPEDAFVHYASSGDRIGNSKVTWCGGPLRSFYSNGNSAWLQQQMKARVNKGDNYDAYFMDDTASSLHSLASGSDGMCSEDAHPNDLCWTSAEYTTDADVVASRAALAKAITHLNGSSAKLVYNGGTLALYNATPDNYIGSNEESSVVWSDTLRPQRYETTLNRMAQANGTSGFFTMQSTGSGKLTSRLVHTAVILLGYSEGHTVSWELFEGGRNVLSIWPEALIYPSQPLQSMTNGAVDLQVARGVWRREFAGCFLAQQRFGGCAVLLNANSQDVPINPAWLNQTYGHSITFSGGDVLSGGQTILNAALPTTVPAAGGVLLSP